MIFDFDGVLVDSEPLHEAAIKEAAAVRGWTMTADHFRRMVGKGDEHAFELLASENRTEITPEEVAALCARKHEACLRLIAAGRFTVQPGAPEVVQTCAHSRPVGVCSGSRREVVLGMLNATPLAAAMSTVVTHEDVTHPKPAPDGYLLAARRLGLVPQRCVVIEDSPTGIRAAKSAGMTVIAVGHSFPQDRLTEADVYVDTIARLLAN